MAMEAAAIAPEHEGVIGVREDGRAFIRFERRLAHPVDRVWGAITDPAEMAEWLACRVEFDARTGGRLALWLGGADAPHVAQYVVTAFEPPHVLEASGAGEDGVLRWELRSEGTGCVLTFTDTRPTGERARNSVLAGWHVLMDQLPEALAGRPTDWRALEATRTEHGHLARIEEIYWHYRNQVRD